MARYALTIFTSAFLLFLVQPLIGKYILPWFGGTPAVWTTCMLFFQVLLLAGYGYAHLLAARLAPSRQAVLHLALLAASVLFLPIIPRESWKLSASESPQFQILLLLLATIGAPYLILSSTGPLLQSWFSRTHPGRSPYRLYSLSNVGSLLALVAYPFVIEPHVRLWNQAIVWSLGYAAFAVLCAWCALALRQSTAAAAVAPTAKDAPAHAEPAEVALPAEQRPSWMRAALWLVLSMAGSVMLLSTTNMMCQDISSGPFLWIAPLALYLVSFIICFDNERWYQRWLWTPLWIGSIAVWCVTLAHGATNRLIMKPGWFDESPLSAVERRLGAALERGWTWAFGQSPFEWIHLYLGESLDDPGLLLQIGIYLTVLFFTVMCCHGELARAKPHPRYLTSFYLTVAAGGALGGIFVALIAPTVFPWYWEYQLGLAASCAAVLFAALDDRRTPRTRLGRSLRWTMLCTAAILLGPLVGILIAQLRMHDEDAVAVDRNFYGVLRVTENSDDNGDLIELIHGEILHGIQYQDEPMRRWATSYYGDGSGINLAIARHPRRDAENPADRGLHIGVVGLGTGSIAALGREGDAFRFYDINPAVERIAHDPFTYLDDTPAEVEVVLGDARVSMERELAAGDVQKFDVLAIDAFSSDSIPMHLLTRECAEIYWKHLKPDGILALHISNRYVDLLGVAQAVADVSKREALVIETEDDESLGLSGSTWVLITSNRRFLDDEDVYFLANDYSDEPIAPVLWTDDFASLWSVLDP